MRELLGLDKPKEAEKPSRKLDEEQVNYKVVTTDAFGIWKKLHDAGEAGNWSGPRLRPARLERANVTPPRVSDVAPTGASSRHGPAATTSSFTRDSPPAGPAASGNPERESNRPFGMRAVPPPGSCSN